MEQTDNCRLAIQLAVAGCARLGHAGVSSGHLVLGLLGVGAGCAYQVLRNDGLTGAAVERLLAKHPGRDAEVVRRDGIDFDASGSLALDRAEAESTTREFAWLGLECLLLGILAEDRGPAADLFAALHVDPASMRRDLEETIASA